LRTNSKILRGESQKWQSILKTQATREDRKDRTSLVKEKREGKQRCSPTSRGKGEPAFHVYQLGQVLGNFPLAKPVKERLYATQRP